MGCEPPPQAAASLMQRMARALGVDLGRLAARGLLPAATLEDMQRRCDRCSAAPDCRRRLEAAEARAARLPMPPRYCENCRFLGFLAALFGR